jgi:hypothetical protein
MVRGGRVLTACIQDSKDCYKPAASVEERPDGQASQASQPREPRSENENGGPAGGSLSLNLGVSTPSPLRATPTPAGHEKDKGNTDEERWKHFIADTKGGLPDSMKYSIPKLETIPLVLARANAQKSSRYNTKAESLAMGISDWAEGRSPSLDGLKCFRWEAWLKETETEFTKLTN